MKKIIILILSSFLFFANFSIINNVYSQSNPPKSANWETRTTSSMNATSDENILWIDNTALREWNVNIDSIPLMIATIANKLIFFSGTVAIFMMIFFAFRMQINSGITGDSSGVDRSRKWMIASAIGFVIAVSAWFVMARVIDVLTLASK